jgi:2-oxoisovalerate dehydrogenase E1 component
MMKKTQSSTVDQAESGLSHELLIDLYLPMIQARYLDEKEVEFTQRGEAFFHVSGGGHEASATLNPHLIPEDWLHCHYRDKALMLARGISLEMFFHSLLARDASHSRGRQMNAHMSDPALNILSLVGPVGNNALQAAGVASVIRDQPEAPVVLCSLGDGTTQEGEVLEAIAEAVRSHLPVLFLVEDNRYAISTLTPGKTFFHQPDGPSNSFYGIPIEHVNGRNVLECYRVFGQTMKQMRATRKPAIIVMNVDRLGSHTNADDQTMYRTTAEISHTRQIGDPLVIFREELLEWGVNDHALELLEKQVRDEISRAAEVSRRSPEPEPDFTARAPLPEHLVHLETEYLGLRPEEDASDRLTMIEAMREVLRHRMASDTRVVLLGEDLEDPKGDVFGLTKGLTEQFPGQVENSALAEATIIGVSIGRALAGKHPVAFLQFADFLPIAYNQIISELGSMFWRTDGGWCAPVIVMITCGGYRPGLGPFHAQTLESIAAHTPGVDVMMPSTAFDAAGLLNAAFESGRPTLFYYPKSCLNDRTRTTSSDVGKQLAMIGKARTERYGDDVTLVGWGNTTGICMRVAATLGLSGIESEVIDLRSISPWDIDRVVESSEKTGHLVVVHEDNHTCGMGAEILATVAEKAKHPVMMRRVTRADTHVPFNFSNQLEVLPSYRGTLEITAALFDYEVEWQKPPDPAPGIHVVEAVGSSPSDESVVVVDWLVAPGDRVDTGQEIATLEADKALLELSSPAAGVVRELLVEKSGMVKVGTPLLTIDTGETGFIRKPVTREEPGTPTLVRGKSAQKSANVVIDSKVDGQRPRHYLAGLSGISTVTGSKNIHNDDLSSQFPEYDSEDIIRRTGIESRVRVDDTQTALSMAVQAARNVLEQEKLELSGIDAIICSTGTPECVTPSMACLLLEHLARDKPEQLIQAHDINAACSGYLYALQNGYDWLQSRPDGKILVVTTEALSPLLDHNDFSTEIIFGDAATATVLYGEEHIGKAWACMTRPELSARGEDGQTIHVPGPGSTDCVRMDGGKVYSEAVRKMINMLEKACRREQITIDDLDLVVPHQANQRIIDAIRNRIQLPEEKVFSNIRNLGNTSSSTIPLALSRLVDSRERGQRIGLCAFGGGFTFGAALLEIRKTG